MNNHEKHSMGQYLRAVNYLTAAQIFLSDNYMMRRELRPSDIKSRLLGHWGSCPGISFAYAHLSRYAKKYDKDMMFVLGPGHGFPALQANLFLEGTLTHFDPTLQMNMSGIKRLCRDFSWPYGYPSHSNPETPGVILEGGELGYSLSTSFGAVMDNPDLTVACLVGDGEAETGPTAGAWHLNKLINPRTDGIVLPILHLNGYKISAPTVFGRMSDYELMSLFSGYGYEPRIVDTTKAGVNPHDAMAEALDWANSHVEKIRASRSDTVPRLPMIILRTLKGWTGVKMLGDDKIEGNCLAHQVVLTEAKTDTSQLALLNDWLASYKFDELFSEAQGFGSYVSDVIPEQPTKRLGMSKHAHGGSEVYQPLKLPEVEEFTETADIPGTMGSSSMRRTGLYLKRVFELNAESKNFRFMSPDETYSNKLDDIFQVVKRSWQWPIKEWDKDLARDGRVMEMLSEHNMQGLMQGYVLTGRHAMFASYEAFLQIVSSMVDQYAKFLTQSRGVEWRGTIPSINYILTSSGWRQDHNGFSHQNPGFLDDLLRRQSNFSDVYFPADGNCTLVALEKMLTSVRQINAIVAGKTVEPRWLTADMARRQIDAGLMIWDFASDEEPDIVMAAAGDYPTKEIMAAIDILKTEMPSIKIRCVNVSSVTTTGFGTLSNTADQKMFDHIFTEDKPVIFNFHGYPQTIKSVLFNYAIDSTRFDIRGYKEIGSTTTPFDMHVRNETSRYDLVIAAFKQLGHDGVVPFEEAEHLAAKYRAKIDENTEYIKDHGTDVPEIDAWVWPPARTLERVKEEEWHGQTN
jgi:xylulose-5-phosphate/fructose-6-phosphate phosphoketolase